MTACQTRNGGCYMPPVYLVTYRTAALTGRHPGPGTEFTSALCRSHADPHTVEVRAEGGEIVAVEDIPQPPPAPILPEPVGLDAVDPPAPAEPVKVRVPRRRGRQLAAGRDAHGG